ncbi:MAG TPA: hypothetical protein VG867_02990 [Rhizomicrobium sp.]|nr:hypothetical protein [Rhizomicrobium sp.]
MADDERTGTSRLQLIIAAVGVVGTFVISGVVATIWVGGIQSRSQNNTVRIEALEARADRQDARLTDVASRLGMAVSKEDEIETQFCDTSNVINLMHANDTRSIAMLWQSVMKTSYPTDNTFYPVLCHKDGKPQ